MKLNIRRHMRFVNPWIFGLCLNKKRGGGAKSVCGFEDPFSNSHTGKTRPIQLSFDAATQTA